MIITIKHVRAIAYCSSGSRFFCDKYGFDWVKFVKEGIDESELLALNDSMATKMVEHAHKIEGE